MAHPKGSAGGGGRSAGGPVAPGQNAKVPTKLPGLADDRWKWNAAGTALATDAERRKQFSRQRKYEKIQALGGAVRAGYLRSSRRALRLTLGGRDSKAYTSLNDQAREALARRSKRADQVFAFKRPPKRMGKAAAASFAKRRANSERVGRAAVTEYGNQSRYLEARTLRPRRY